MLYILEKQNETTNIENKIQEQSKQQNQEDKHRKHNKRAKQIKHRIT